MMQPLKQAIFTRIRLDWPATLEEWDVRHSFYKAAHGRNDSDYPYPDPAPVIRTARLYDTSLLVPSLYYELSTRDPSKIRWNLVGEKDLVIAFVGRQRMLNWIVERSTRWTKYEAYNPWKCTANFPDEKRSECCSTFRTCLFTETYTRLISCTDLLKGLEFPIGKKRSWNQWFDEFGESLEVNLCDSCDLASNARWKTLRNELFERFPEFFKIL